MQWREKGKLKKKTAVALNHKASKKDTALNWKCFV